MPDTRDSCRRHANPEQADIDGNDVGDVCDPFSRYLIGARDTCAATPGVLTSGGWPLGLLILLFARRRRNYRPASRRERPASGVPAARA